MIHRMTKVFDVTKWNGRGQLHPHPLVRNVFWTEGWNDLIEGVSAHCLIDFIALQLHDNRRLDQQHCQAWRIEPSHKNNRPAVIEAWRDEHFTGRYLVRRQIECTSFSSAFEWYVFGSPEHWTILLKSEYEIYRTLDRKEAKSLDAQTSDKVRRVRLARRTSTSNRVPRVTRFHA